MEGAAEIYHMLAPTRVMNEWSEAEHARLLEGLKIFGKDYVKLVKHVNTKSKEQVSFKIKRIYN